MSGICARFYNAVAFSCQPSVIAEAIAFVQTTVAKLSSFAITHFSAKQAVRPDTAVEAIMRALPKMRLAFWVQCARVNSIYIGISPSQDCNNFRVVLLSIARLMKDKNSPLDDIDLRVWQATWDLVMTRGFELSRFDAFVHGSDNAELKTSHHALKTLVKLLDARFYEDLRERLTIAASDSELSAESRLSLPELVLVGNSSSMASLSEALARTDMSETQELHKRWKTIADINGSPVFVRLKRLCMEKCRPGTVLISDRAFMEHMYGSYFGTIRTAIEVLMGRLAHMAYCVEGANNSVQMSHVNSATNSHAVVPLRSPFVTPFSSVYAFDIASLFPAAIKEEDRVRLTTEFPMRIQRLASVKQDLNLAYIFYPTIVLFGHKSPFAKPLAEVDLPPEGSGISCSSYVGIIFLMAIKEVNLELVRLGYTETIPHPFGEHENLVNLDVLRLLYLWKRVNVIREVGIDPTVAKIIKISDKLTVPEIPVAEANRRLIQL